MDDLLSLRIVNHSTIALGELTHLYGRMDPSHPDTRRTLQAISAVIDDIPIHRLTAPSARAFGEAGMLAGLTARRGGRAAGVALRNDALLYLHAREMGYEVLTGNIGAFDLFDQVLPGSSVRLYRLVQGAARSEPIHSVREIGGAQLGHQGVTLATPGDAPTA